MTLETDEDIVRTILKSLRIFDVVIVLFQVTEIKIKYFDTVPVANSLCILKTGFLFVAAEFGNQ